MKNKSKSLTIKVLLLVILGSILSVITFTYFSPSSLHKLAGSVANDSSLYKYSMTRIIQIYDKNPDSVLSVVLNDYNKDNRYFYVNTVLISIFADEKSLIALDEEINKINRVNESIYTDSYVSLLIESIGIGMMTNKVDFLEQLLDELNKTNSKSNLRSAVNYIVARSLFYITGETYEYKSTNKDNAKIRITDDILSVRNVLVNSKGRKRTAEEMTLLLNFI